MDLTPTELANFKAEVKVGIKNFNIPTDEALKKIDEFMIFYNEWKETANVSFYLVLGNKLIIVNYYGYFTEERNSKNLKEYGIIKKHNNSSKEYKEYIHYKKAPEVFKLNLELGKVKTILREVIGDLKIENTTNIIKDIKEYLSKNENNFISKPSALDGSEEIIIKEFLDELKFKDVKTEDFNFPKVLLPRNQISKVYEKENLRIAIGIDNNELMVILATPQSQIYNYLDEKRKIEYESYPTKLHIFDEDTTEKEIEEFEKHQTFYRGEYIQYISKEEVKRLIKKYILEEQLEEQKSKQENEIEEKLNKEMEEKSEVTLHNIKREKGGFFEFQNQRIGYKNYSIKKINWEEKDFNVIFDIICLDAYRNYDTPISVGSFEVTLTIDYNTSYTYILGVRINNGEMLDCLKRAICYNSIEEYKTFLKEVSKCSIKIHNAISGGLTYNLNWKSGIFTRIYLVRKGNNFIKDKSKKLYRVSNTNALIDMEKLKKYSYRDVNTHILAETLEKFSQLNYEEAIGIIKEGLNEYKEAIKKAEELLKETISKLNIKTLDVDNEEIKEKGYLIKGNSNQEYFVTKTLKIYKYPSFKYICVIDKEANTINTTDKLISRLYALKNDNHTGNKEMIFTLN